MGQNAPLAAHTELDRLSTADPLSTADRQRDSRTGLVAGPRRSTAELQRDSRTELVGQQSSGLAGRRT